MNNINNKEIHVCRMSRIVTDNGIPVLRKNCMLDTYIKEKRECVQCSNYISSTMKKLPEFIEKYGFKTVR